MTKPKIAIVGHGFVGGAVGYAFDTGHNDVYIVDPKYDTDITDLYEFQPDWTFIAAPTPMFDNGRANVEIVLDAIGFVLCNTNSEVVIKSTVPASTMEHVYDLYVEDRARILYNPEFLTETNARREFVNPTFMIIGGDENTAFHLTRLYQSYSRMVVPGLGKICLCSLQEAAFIKYSINCFLATKVTFFNQLADVVNGNGSRYNVVSKGVALDPRIGPSHINVPGPDGRKGFGGACFPKDVAAFVRDYPELTLLETAMEVNNDYRRDYEPYEREAVNNIDYGEDTTG